MLIRFIIMGAIVLIVCSVDMSHLALDESTERLLYFDDSEESADGNDGVAEEESVTEAEEPAEEQAPAEHIEESMETEPIKHEEPISSSDDADDFEEDFGNADDFLSAIYEAGDEEE